jgi:hypothetical protein
MLCTNKGCYFIEFFNYDYWMVMRIILAIGKYLIAIFYDH